MLFEVSPEEARISAAASGLSGSLDKEILRRVIRSHIVEVMNCYEAGWNKNPDIAGRVMVRFTIAATGEVTSSVLQHSTVDDAAVERCTVAAVRRWKFPKPVGGGRLIVSYPFTVTRADDHPVVIFAGNRGAGAVEIRKLSTKFFIHHTTDQNGVPANGLLALTDGGALMVDTGWTEQQTEAIVRWTLERFKRPFVGAVITHDHPDRAGGVAALLRRGIPVGAVDLTVAKLNQRGVRGVSTLFAAGGGVSAAFAGFRDPRGFELFYPGPGHAPDNIVVAFPGSGVVFGGCLIKSSDAQDLGYVGDANLAGWPAAIRRVTARYPDMFDVVSGHGAGYGRAAVQRTLELLSPVTKKAAVGLSPGGTAGQ